VHAGNRETRTPEVNIMGHLGLVVRGDLLGRGFERGQDISGDSTFRSLDLRRVNSGGDELNTIKPLGEFPKRVVAAGFHCGQDLAHGIDRAVGWRNGSGQPFGDVADKSAEVDTGKHPHTLAAPVCASGEFTRQTARMNSDAAELSSLTTVVADVAARVGKLAENRSDDPDDPLVGRLYEIERALITAERRLRSTSRDLD
jgi:hypothetical protein